MNRRELLSGAGASLFAGTSKSAVDHTPPLPDNALFERSPEQYWARIRKEQFLLADDFAFLNTGSLGVAPRPVLKAVDDYLKTAAAMQHGEGLPRWGGEPLTEMRQELAAFFGCKTDELALTHNTTEGMNTIANGLDLKPGDEVLLSSQEHPGGTFCWMQKQARFGIIVRRVELPIPPGGPGQLVDAFRAAIGPDTRVISFSGCTTQTGLIMPIREICEIARSRGILSVVDGAHLNGQIPVNFHAYGCDFLAASPHKWMLTPAGCGVLYIREEMLDRLWVNVASTGWDDRKLKAVRFQMVGTNNRGIFEGHLAALRFVQQIGPERIYRRIHELAQDVRERVARIPKAKLLTPANDRLYGGMVTFEIRGLGESRLAGICKQRKIWAVVGDHTRIAVHIHTRPSDLDRFFAAVRGAIG
jgi:isopenicillin-N epimerase